MMHHDISRRIIKRGKFWDIQFQMTGLGDKKWTNVGIAEPSRKMIQKILETIEKDIRKEKKCPNKKIVSQSTPTEHLQQKEQ